LAIQGLMPLCGAQEKGSADAHRNHEPNPCFWNAHEEGHILSRPITLFTGQWADLPAETLAEKASSWGYDGLELACWGDHFEVGKALEDEGYCDAKRAMLKKH